MTKQEFLQTYLVERCGTDCSKWGGLKEKFGGENLLATRVADMEFKTCDEIVEAMMERTQYGVFRYSCVSDDYYQVFSDWMERRYHFPIREEWIRFSTGCVTAIAWMIRAFTKPGDSCMILIPVHYPLHSMVANGDRNLVGVELNYDNGYFTMDYKTTEEAIVGSQVKIFIQCSPHDPAGGVWTEEELNRVLEVCRGHGALVISDEIHQDIVLGEKPLVPAAIVSEGKYRGMVITPGSASKTFNLVTLLHSHIIIASDELRKTYDRLASALNRTEVSIIGMITAKASYTCGKEWLGHILSIVHDNYQYLKEEVNKQLPELTVCALEGTYLVMIDLRSYVDMEQLLEFVQKQYRLAVGYDERFGGAYKGFIRLNLATSPDYVKQTVERIITQID